MRSSTARQLLEKNGIINVSFGCHIFDRVTGGGITLGITEISGEAGTGKTQLCLSLSAQLAQCGQSVAYLSCGEGDFPMRRLCQLLPTINGKSREEILSKIHIMQCYNAEDALSTSVKALPLLCQEKDVKLVIIDSMAGLVRSEYDSKSSSDMRDRTNMLFALASEFKRLSDTYKLCVVVVNQVTADFNQVAAGYSAAGSSEDFGSATIPALGLAWSHCVNTRIMLRRETASILLQGPPSDAWSDYAHTINNIPVLSGNDVDDDALLALDLDATTSATSTQQRPAQEPLTTSAVTSKSRRQMTVEFSPRVTRSSVAYEITGNGVFGIQ